MIAAVQSFLLKCCSENVWKISRRTSASDCNFLSYKFRETEDWLNPHNDENKVPQNLENKLTGLHISKAF